MCVKSSIGLMNGKDIAAVAGALVQGPRHHIANELPSLIIGALAKLSAADVAHVASSLAIAAGSSKSLMDGAVDVVRAVIKSGASSSSIDATAAASIVGSCIPLVRPHSSDTQLTAGLDKGMVHGGTTRLL